MAENETLTPDEWGFWDAWTSAQRLFGQEVERVLQREFGISKAEFSVLVTLHRADVPELRVGDLADRLGWDKSRVAHQLTRMENRGLVARAENGISGRRTGIGLTPEGRRLAEASIRTHAGTIRRLFLDSLAPEQSTAISKWSQQMIERANAGWSDSTPEVTTPPSHRGN